MKKPSLQKPSRVERARAHLDGAVARLEAAAKSRRQQSPLGEEQATGTDDLTQELEALRDENIHLKALNETVSDRLNSAISRIKSVIEN